MNDIGHNQPDELTARVQDLLETARRWIDERPEIADEDTAKKLQTFLMQINAAKTTVDNGRKDGKKPWLDGAKEVDADFMPVLDGLNGVKDALEVRLRAYMLANGLTSIKGDLSPRASGLRVTWRAECSDLREALTWAGTEVEVKEAIIKIAERRRKLAEKAGVGYEAPGITFHKEHKVV